ncbi:MAG: preprotein translocase subunit SecG [Pseudomonadota bacterium]|nr:preprotein translocase subunit SecG [Pseudomonadota bacterium]
MFSALLILQVLLGLSIIGLVLLQQGKGADMGAAFGAGSAGTVFGSRGGGSFLTRTTAVLAAGFFLNSILLSSPLVRNVQDPNASVTERVAAPQASDVPAVEETVQEEAVDLPPADLPDVPEQSEEASSETAQDLPPADVPEQSEQTEKAE